MLRHGNIDPGMTRGEYNEKKNQELLYSITYEVVGVKCFALCCYENESIASVVNFYLLMAIHILQLAWTAASCKHS